MLPNFLYDHNHPDFSVENLEGGLLCGPVAISVSDVSYIVLHTDFYVQSVRGWLTGQRTVNKPEPGPSPGPKTIAEIFNLRQMSPELISYGLTLVSSHVADQTILTSRGCRHVWGSRVSVNGHSRTLASRSFDSITLSSICSRTRTIHGSRKHWLIGICEFHFHS